MFLFAGRCEESGYLSIFFGFWAEVKKTHVAAFRPGSEAQMHIHQGPTGSVGADDNQSADGCARGGSGKNAHRRTQTLSVKVISVSL